MQPLRAVRRRRFSVWSFLGLALGLTGCPPTNPNPPAAPSSGNLQVWSAFARQFQATITQDPAVYNASQLGDLPVVSIANAGLNVRYDDGFSTDASQTEIVVLARDPQEMETTLEQIVGKGSTAAFEDQV